MAERVDGPRNGLLFGLVWLGFMWFMVEALNNPVRATQAPWTENLGALNEAQAQLFQKLQGLHQRLVLLAEKEDPQWLSELSLQPKPRPSGYGLLPEVSENKPSAPVVPTATHYSFDWIRERLVELNLEASRLGRFASENGTLDELVPAFKTLRDDVDNLQAHLDYHEQWQASIARYPVYFQKRSELLPIAESLQNQLREHGESEGTAQLRSRILSEIGVFRPVDHLQLVSNGESQWLLPVSLCTDIEDAEFLRQFEAEVRSAFRWSDEDLTLEVDLNWQRFTPATLYAPDPAPLTGEPIEISAHIDRFEDCPLILTTGAAYTWARVGEHIVLGTAPVAGRTLAHEFAHLLGFEDLYLRAWRGTPESPDGVTIIEWTGLTDDLLGDSGKGRVSRAMVDQLIGAYANGPEGPN